MNYHHYSNKSNTLWTIAIIIGLFGGFKLIFTILGLVLALIINFFPLIIGAFLIFKFTNKGRYQFKMSQFINKRQESHQQFVELIVRILIHLAKADGKVSTSEKQTIRHFFQTQLQFDSQQTLWVNDLITHSESTPESLETCCTELKQRYNYQSLLIVIELLYAVALADGIYHQNEEKVIQEICQHLAISATDHSRIRNHYLPKENELDTHFKVLGLNKNASKNEIKKAYRKLSKEYHPDKVRHLGKEFQRIAEEKMVTLNKAYQAIYK